VVDNRDARQNFAGSFDHRLMSFILPVNMLENALLWGNRGSRDPGSVVFR